MVQERCGREYGGHFRETLVNRKYRRWQLLNNIT